VKVKGEDGDDGAGKEKERSKTPNRDKSGSRLETLPKEKQSI
jgi:hypothetical protein